MSRHAPAAAPGGAQRRALARLSRPRPLHPRARLPSLLLPWLLLPWLLAPGGCAQRVREPAPAGPTTSWVDPFIGTGGHGHTYPGATVPFGMVQLSPDNGRNGWDWTSGYHWTDSVIVGFSHTHLSGTGIGDLEDILVMPVTGPVRPARAGSDSQDVDFRSRFSHDEEEAEPGYYAVRLRTWGVRAELTATTRVGVHRYTFPAGPEAGIVLDLGYSANWDRPLEAELERHGDTLVTGHRFSTGWAEDERVYFAAALSRRVAGVRLAADGRELPAGARRARGRRVRALLRLPAPDSQVVVLKVGISYVDEAGALRNLREEVPDWDFDRVRREAREAWEAALGRVRVRVGRAAARGAGAPQGGRGSRRGSAPRASAEDLRRIFYTALYHTKLAPIRFDDVDRRYRGADGRIHRESGFRNYSIFSLWDTFRAEHPLLTLAEPERVDDLVESMLAFGRQSGYLPVWSLVGNETNTMTGYHAVPVIADAYLKGFRGFDPDSALALMVRSAARDWRGIAAYRRYGYVPSELEVESVTKTLEYAFDDWSIARMAGALGRTDTEARFDAQAGSWAHLLDPATRFMRGRHADGSWVEPFDPRRSSHRRRTDYTEGNAWQHTWFVPQDPAGLIAAMGGDGPFVAKLDSLFQADTTVTGERVSPDISGLIGQYAHGNEPSHHIAYLYSYAGAPWKTAERVRQILTTLYGSGPDGLAGNEDCGQMSAWYVFSALGFYPANPVGGIYVLGSPLFEESELDVGRGRAFRVVAEGVSERNRYIRSARLNGRPLSRSWIRHQEITAGGELRLEMGPEPNPEWGRDPAARPPSGLPEAVSRGADPTWSDQAARVVEEFRHAWRGYRKYAWGHDALRPLSRRPRDWYGASLYMTPVDAFDTMRLMGLDEDAAEAKELVLSHLSFDHGFGVQVFEVTIRLLGGLLSAYQLDGDPRWLSLARDLGDRLLPAFDSPTGMPYTRVNLRTGATEGPVSNPAEVGTLMLEFGALARLTGRPVYYDRAKRAVRELFRRRSPIGLLGSAIDVETGEWKDRDSHVGGRIDSYYEYLLKAWLLFGDEDFRDMWEAAVSAADRYLADERPTGLWYGHADMETGRRGATRFGALDAFLPGVLALAGERPRAERLMASVFSMWTRFGIEPEQLDYARMEPVDASYALRPEALESVFYLFRLTGDERYRAMGRAMFESLVRRCRTEAGYAALDDVRSGTRRDEMESFFLAETLKYAYLLFAPRDVLSLRWSPGADVRAAAPAGALTSPTAAETPGGGFREVVFTTEAHPLRRTWE
ncbi:MAG: GH92 family glycosyl hydrolase [Gemmatimonadota bacterium]